MITSVMSFTKFHKIPGNMMTSSKTSRDLGYHFDFFWKYLWWVWYLLSLRWIGRVLLEKTRWVILTPPPTPKWYSAPKQGSGNRVKKIISRKKYVGCKIFVMQWLYVSMWWNLLTFSFNKKTFLLGQKTTHNLFQVMTLLMKVNQKIKNTVVSHWQIPKKYPRDEEVFLIYESKLLELIKYCMRCRNMLTSNRELKTTGSQLIAEMQQRCFGFFWMLYFLWCF